MATPAGMRVGDADREAVASRLREHYAHGRLTLEEFQERLDATFAARTDLDLNRITSDLPHTAAYPGPLAAVQPSGRQHDGGGYRQRSRPRSAAFAQLTWLIVVVMIAATLLLPSWFPVPGRIAILLAIFTFGRRIVRRIFGFARMSGSGRRR